MKFKFRWFRWCVSLNIENGENDAKPVNIDEQESFRKWLESAPNNEILEELTKLLKRNGVLK